MEATECARPSDSAGHQQPAEPSGRASSLPQAAVIAAVAASVRYADASYWNERYQVHNTGFDWFYGYTALRRIVRDFLRRNKHVLHIGCGNSNFQEGLSRDGYKVINTDISDVVIEQMRAQHKDMPNLSYIVSDCRAMPEFMDCQFGAVIDKGTVDALLCCSQAADNIHKMFSEVSRVLSPGGTFLLVTLGAPHQRLPLLNHPEFGWNVQLVLVPRVGAEHLLVNDPTRQLQPNDTVRSLRYLGPLDMVHDGSGFAGLPEPFDPSAFFYAYLCKKHPLQLRGMGDLAHGLEPSSSTRPLAARARLPEGWTATAQAVASALHKELGLPGDVLSRGRRVRTVPRSAFERQPAAGPGEPGATPEACAASCQTAEKGLGLEAQVEALHVAPAAQQPTSQPLDCLAQAGAAESEPTQQSLEQLLSSMELVDSVDGPFQRHSRSSVASHAPSS